MHLLGSNSLPLHRRVPPPRSSSSPPPPYALVIDAGSSGSRLFVYRIEPSHEDTTMVHGKGKPGKEEEEIEKEMEEEDEEEEGGGLGLRIPKLSLVSHPTVHPWNLKTEPGLSSYVDTPDLGVRSLMPLFEHAKLMIPNQDDQLNTPWYIFGTAGLRLLSTSSSSSSSSGLTTLIQRLCDTVPTLWPTPHLRSIAMGCPVHHVKVISGIEEGWFGWLTLNRRTGMLTWASSLLNEDLIQKKKKKKKKQQQHEKLEASFSNPKRRGLRKTRKRLGFLDLGGGSTQLAYSVDEHQPPPPHNPGLFPPPLSSSFTDEASKKTSWSPSSQQSTVVLQVPGHPKESIHVVSYLGLGTHEIEQQYFEDQVHQMETLTPMEEKETSLLNLSHPLNFACYPPEYPIPPPLSSSSSSSTTRNGTSAWIGQGNFNVCRAQLKKYLQPTNTNPSTSMASTWLSLPPPSLTLQPYWVGVSEYYYIVHDYYGLSDTFLNMGTLMNMSQAFCARPYPGQDPRRGRQCLKSAWLSTLLLDGYASLFLPSNSSSSSLTSSSFFSNEDKDKDKEDEDRESSLFRGWWWSSFQNNPANTVQPKKKETDDANTPPGCATCFLNTFEVQKAKTTLMTSSTLTSLSSLIKTIDIAPHLQINYSFLLSNLSIPNETPEQPCFIPQQDLCPWPLIPLNTLDQQELSWTYGALLHYQFLAPYVTFQTPSSLTPLSTFPSTSLHWFEHTSIVGLFMVCGWVLLVLRKQQPRFSTPFTSFFFRSNPLSSSNSSMSTMSLLRRNS